MNGKLQKNIGLSLVIFAFFFLFDPSYALIDPLPDFIGYAILCIAIINLADINDRIMDAFRGFRKAMVLSILRCVSIFVTNKVFAEGENTVGQLIFVFVFAFFEIFIAIPAYKSLFEGLLSLATFNDGEAVFKKIAKNGRNCTEKLYTLTSVFIVVKNTLCALPEFTSLQTNSSYEFVHILRLFAIFAVIPLSVVWLINIIKYFVSVRRDTNFIETLSAKYLEKADKHPEFFLSRIVCTGLYGIIVSCVLSFDIYSGNVNYLPDLFFFIALILSAIFLKKYSHKWVPIVILSAFGNIFSLLLYSVESSFFERHFIGAIKRDIEAYEHYYFMLSLYILQAVFLVAVIILVACFLRDINKKHLVDISSELPKANALPLSFKARFWVFLGTGVASVVSDVWHIFALPYFKRGAIYEYSGIIASAISIAFIASAIVLVTYCVGEVKRYYKTDI